jgi:DNA-binding transcriptional LysR family regulator
MDERSVSRAATRLRTSQPTMSRLLGRLRLFFADPLLVWAGGHMVPTPRALALETEVRHVVETMMRLSSPDQSFDPSVSEAKIVLTAAGYLENIFLADVMKQVAVKAPAISIEVRAPNRMQDMQALERGEIDFIVGWTVTAAPSLRSRVLFADRLICIARAGHPKLRDDRLTYEKYLQLPQIQYDVPGRTTTGILLEQRLAQDGSGPVVKFRVHNSLTVGEVVANSDLIATVPNKFAMRFLKQYPLKILELPVRLPQMQNRAYWHERMQSDPRSRWFRRLLADAAKKIDNVTINP